MKRRHPFCRPNRVRAFTLIELLIVMAIVIPMAAAIGMLSNHIMNQHRMLEDRHQIRNGAHELVRQFRDDVAAASPGSVVISADGTQLDLSLAGANRGEPVAVRYTFTESTILRQAANEPPRRVAGHADSLSFSPEGRATILTAQFSISDGIATQSHTVRAVAAPLLASGGAL